MLQGILIMVVFFALAGLMIARKIPTLVAMILLAIITCIIAGVPIIGQNEEGAQIGWLHTIVETGAARMSTALIAVIFGSWMGHMMNRTGVTETIIKKSAEFGGDRPLVVALVMIAANALLSTTGAGLGSVIMVGSIILPILISVGIPGPTAAGLYLISLNVGMTFNVANWQTFSSIFSLEIPVIQQFMTYMMVASLAAAIVFVTVQYLKNGRKFAFSAPAKSDKPAPVETDTRPLKGVVGVLAVLAPLIPIVLVVVFKIPVIPSFLTGIIWLVVVTAKSFAKAMNLLIQTAYEGIAAIASAITLLIALGILYVAVTNPMVKQILDPFILAIIPTSRLVYIIFFILVAPLCLYRGPMNLFGFGTGIAALIISLGTLNPMAVMGAFLSAERVQGVGDPTNTHNVWVANFVETDVTKMSQTLWPYLWGIAAVGVILSAIIYF